MFPMANNTTTNVIVICHISFQSLSVVAIIIIINIGIIKWCLFKEIELHILRQALIRVPNRIA